MRCHSQIPRETCVTTKKITHPTENSFGLGPQVLYLGCFASWRSTLGRPGVQAV